LARDITKTLDVNDYSSALLTYRGGATGGPRGARAPCRGRCAPPSGNL